MREHFPPNKDAAILDVGCGHGAVLYFAQAAGFVNARGVDGSPEQVAEAARLGIPGVVQGDLMTALRACPAESLDAVVAFDVIEHFTRTELLTFADEVHRGLRRGGRFIIHTPNGDSPFCGMMRYHDFTHELAFTRASINQMLRSCGFADVRCYEDAPVPHGAKSSARWLLWKVIRAALRFYLAVETGSAPSDTIFSQNFLTVATK
jgi:cyclopropane fatty-acyl-phospholipid synthase-like methyltransferase